MSQRSHRFSILSVIVVEESCSAFCSNSIMASRVQKSPFAMSSCDSFESTVRVSSSVSSSYCYDCAAASNSVCIPCVSSKSSWSAFQSTVICYNALFVSDLPSSSLSSSSTQSSSPSAYVASDRVLFSLKRGVSVGISPFYYPLKQIINHEMGSLANCLLCYLFLSLMQVSFLRLFFIMVVVSTITNAGSFDCYFLLIPIITKI